MRIYTSYFANIKNLPENIVPISISGWPPKGWQGLQYKVLAPKWGFFQKYKEDHDEVAYTKAFHGQVLLGLSKDIIRARLEELSGGKDVALCCYEKVGDFCHRHIVAEWLGPDVKEWEKEEEEIFFSSY